MRPQRQTHRATWALIGAALLLGTACGDDDEDDSSDTIQPDSTTTTESTTTTIAAEGPEEWIEVVRDLNQRYFALLQDPDPAQVATVYAETCPCYQQNHDTVQVLADGDEHIEGVPVGVSFVKLERQDPTTQAVELTIREVMTDGWRRVDQEGTVVQDLPADEPGCAALTLFPDGADGSYRIHNRTPLTGCPPEAG
jgi:hypothetical protein